MTSKQPKPTRQKTAVRVICALLAVVLVLSSVAMIFNLLG